MSRNGPGAPGSTHRRSALPWVFAIALGLLLGVGAFAFDQVAAINWNAAK